jgi:hypothetical protein
MKTLIAAAVIAVVGAIGIVSPQAMPFSPHDPALIKVIQGCGPNGHRGPFGRCRARFSCPPGWHSGPHGWYCFRN